MYNWSAQYYPQHFKTNCYRLIDDLRPEFDNEFFKDGDETWEKGRGMGMVRGARYKSTDDVWNALVSILFTEGHFKMYQDASNVEEADRIAFDLGNRPDILRRVTWGALRSAAECDYFYLREVVY